MIYWCVALGLGAAVVLLVPFLSDHWLKAVTLSHGTLHTALSLMALTLLFQVPSVSFVRT